MSDKTIFDVLVSKADDELLDELLAERSPFTPNTIYRVAKRNKVKCMDMCALLERVRGEIQGEELVIEIDKVLSKCPEKE